MTEQGPAEPGFEYLGERPGPREASARRTPRRRRALVGLTAGALVVAGAAGALAVAQFLDSGPQAASAAPADTMAWLQVDLDPAGGQKLAAYRTLKKFPALEKHLGLTSQDDLRRWVFEGLTSGTDCDTVDFAEVEPWLGSALGAGVRPGRGDAEPTVFLALEVTDHDKAVAGADDLARCLGEDQVGTAFTGDFMVVAETDATAQAVADAAGSSALADDPTYAARTGEAGDDGVVTAYAAPALGDYLADQLGNLGGGMLGRAVDDSGGSSTMAGRAGALTEDTAEPGADEPTPAPQNQQSQQTEPGTMPSDLPTELPSDFPSDFPTTMPSDFPSDLRRGEDDLGGGYEMPMSPFMLGGPALLLGRLSGFGGFDQLGDKLADFEGAAMQARFADESLEVEIASHGLGGDVADTEAVDLSDLPSGTGLALGLATGEKWAEATRDRLRSADPQGFDREMAKASRESGLSLPDDLTTLAGDSLTLAVDSTVDLSRLAESFFAGPVESIKAGVRIAGDPDQIGPVADELAAFATREDGPAVTVARGEHAVAIGFDKDYVARLAEDGDLGSSAAYQRALPDDGDAVGAVFADFDAHDWLVRAIGGSEEETANLAPLSGLGVTTTRDGDVLHATLRLSTD
jgi:hypothetical protein